MEDFTLRLQELRRCKDHLWAVHYACESWHEVKDRPVAICCIALTNCETHGSSSFSITDFKENAEAKMLEEYYQFLRSDPERRFMHWNMNSSQFGFDAIDIRYRYLTGKEAPYRIPNGMTQDLDDLVTFRYGNDFAKHPKLHSLAILNDHNKRFMLSGKDEADKYAKGEYGDVKSSAIEKSHLLAYLSKRFMEGRLITQNSGPRVEFARETLDAVEIVKEIGGRLKEVSRQLSRRHDKRPTLKIEDEYDFQDLFHALLRIFFEDVRREEWTPSYAGAASRIDFLLPAHGAVIELKHSRPKMTSKTLGEELIVDRDKYRQHPLARILVCLVLDWEGLIENPAGLETDLSEPRDGFATFVKILR